MNKAAPFSCPRMHWYNTMYCTTKHDQVGPQGKRAGRGGAKGPVIGASRGKGQATGASTTRGFGSQCNVCSQVMTSVWKAALWCYVVICSADLEERNHHGMPAFAYPDETADTCNHTAIMQAPGRGKTSMLSKCDVRTP